MNAEQGYIRRHSTLRDNHRLIARRQPGGHCQLDLKQSDRARH